MSNTLYAAALSTSSLYTWSGQQTFNGGIAQVGATTSTSSKTWNQFYLAPAPVGATSGSYTTVASSIQYNSASDNSGAVNAISAVADLYGAGVSNQTTAVRAIARSLGNGGAYSAGSLYGGLFEAGTNGTSSFDHAIGIKINGPTDNGNVAFQSGLYIANQTNLGSATITLQDALHIEGKSGTDTAVNSIGFGNGTSGLNAHIFSPTTNVIALVGTSGITLNGIPALTSGVFASKPGAPVTGQTYLATDIGSGVVIIYNGSKWKPLGGSAIIYSDSALRQGAGTGAEANYTNALIPAGLVSATGGVRLYAAPSHSGVVGGKTVIIRHTTASDSVSGGTTLLSSTLGGSGTALSGPVEKTVLNIAAVNSQVSSASGSGGYGSATSGAQISGAIDFAAASYLNFNVNGNVLDTVGYQGIVVWWFEG